MTVAMFALSAISIVASALSSEGECDPSSLLQTTVNVDRIGAAGPFSELFDHTDRVGPPETRVSLQQSVDAESSQVLFSMLDELADFEKRSSSHASLLNSSNSSNSNNTNASEDSSAVGDAAAATGVTGNSDDDIYLFLTGLATVLVTILCAVVFFMIARRYFPVVYEGNIVDKTAPATPGVQRGASDWIWMSLAVTTDQVQDSAGLDMAMLLEYCHLGMNIMAFLSIPMLLILAPLNFLFGGNAAGKDYLSYLSLGNVEYGSWIVWVDCAAVWVVVCIVQINLYQAMQLFMRHRLRWLQELPPSRANTILVENIPEQCRSDAALKAHFENIFGSNSVRFARCVKLCPGLTALVEKRDAARKAAEDSMYERAQGRMTNEDVRTLQDLAEAADVQVRAKKADVSMIADATTGGINTSTGFVQFHSRSHAELATGAQFSHDIDTWNISMPPPAESILWDSFKTSEGIQIAKKVFGYLLVACLFVGYLPCVIFISNTASLLNLGVLQPLWQAFAPTLGLQIMIAFLPTFLICIFYTFFSLPDAVVAQEMLQHWYFVFQVVFVLLVTAIGPSLFDFLKAPVTQPSDIFRLLGDALPTATHFYMNFLVLQWASHFANLTRSSQLVKFIFFKRIMSYGNPKELSEPEDQDYYGIGSRSTRFTINMCIGIVYGTMSPPIIVLTFLNFAVCRLVYGYLIPFAETRKPDLGGTFFVSQLNHTFVGTGIYCICMTGVLLGRADTMVPGAIAGGSLLYVLWSYQRFTRKFDWVRLPVNKVGAHEKPPNSQDSGISSSLSSVKGFADLFQHELSSGTLSEYTRELGFDKTAYVQPEFLDKPREKPKFFDEDHIKTGQDEQDEPEDAAVDKEKLPFKTNRRYLTKLTEQKRNKGECL
mmetsp:Transcript_112187/g.210405  ORF Transcript_112187/g.210405 Transcript_112187/m.210405 type:complete len:884 (+) Transcript_112187:141-2792(+)